MKVDKGTGGRGVCEEKDNGLKKSNVFILDQ